MITVLHFIPSIDESSGGVGAYMQLIARDLGKLVDLHILTHKSTNERHLENCTIHYISNKWYPWHNCKQEFLQLLEILQPDVFHTNSCWTPLSAMTAIWAKSIGKIVVYTPHGMLEPWALHRNALKKQLAIAIYQKKALKISDVIHATAESEKQNLLELGWNKNVMTIANCVQIDEIQMKSSWKRKKNILFLSRIHVKKGINFLIEAVSQMKDELRGYNVTIAGPGDVAYVNELKSLALSRNVNEMIHFIGPVYAENKWPLYRTADVFVLPTWSENFGIVVPEALASGTPVITTVGTPWKELNDCNCGWCTDIGTEPTVEALKKFLDCSEADLEQMGRNGRKLVEDKYTSKAIATLFVEMYNQVCQV